MTSGGCSRRLLNERQSYFSDLRMHACHVSVRVWMYLHFLMTNMTHQPFYYLTLDTNSHDCRGVSALSIHCVTRPPAAPGSCSAATTAGRSSSRPTASRPSPSACCPPSRCPSTRASTSASWPRACWPARWWSRRTPCSCPSRSTRPR